jgi:hypothetical protein
MAKSSRDSLYWFVKKVHQRLKPEESKYLSRQPDSKSVLERPRLHLSSNCAPLARQPAQSSRLLFRDPRSKLQIGGWHAVSTELLPAQGQLKIDYQGAKIIYSNKWRSWDQIIISVVIGRCVALITARLWVRDRTSVAWKPSSRGGGDMAKS